jgi:putative aminopeptidase FrvX
LVFVDLDIIMAKKEENTFFSEKSMTFLKTYLSAAAPSGQEQEGQRIWLKHLQPLVDESFMDNYGNAVGVINPKAKYKVIIEAHADEISWMVKYITDEGLIHVCKNGDTDHQIAPSMRVNIHTDSGIIKGVFGWPSIGLRDDDKKPAPLTHKLWIDVGAKTKQQVLDLGIHVGCQCTYAIGFEELNYGHWTSRAFDNKIGGFIIAEVARKLQEDKIKLPFGLYIVNAVQEEVGMYGAAMIVEQIEPDMAICTDVTFDTTTPFHKKHRDGEVACGNGPVINFAPAIHKHVQQLIIQTAKSNNIPLQYEANTNDTATDTESLAYGSCGVPSALISMPLRYMHTSVELLHKSDVEHCIQLIYQTLKNIDPKVKIKF